MLRLLQFGIFILGMGLVSGCLDLPEAAPYQVPEELDQKIYDTNEKGINLIQEGRYEEAIASLEESIGYVYEVDPELEQLDREKRVPALLDAPFNNLSWAYHDMGDYEKALAYADKSMLMLPNDDVESVNRANALYGLNRIDEALSSYEEAIRLNSRNSEANYGIGMIKIDRGDYADALKRFNNYLKEYPADGDAAAMRVYTLLRLDRGDVAQEYADNFMERYSDAYEGTWAKGAYIEETAEYDEIAKFYEDVAALYPSEWLAHRKLGQIYYEYGEYEAALKLFQGLTVQFPEEPELDEWLIRVYGALGDMEGAEGVYTGSDDPHRLLMVMGQFYLDQGHYMKAVSFFGAEIVNNPANQNGYAKKLQALSWGKRYARCAEFGAQVLEALVPVSADIPWYTGWCEMELGNDEAAAKHFRQATEIDPDDYEAWSNLALTQLKLGNEAEARKYSERALEIYDNDSTATYVKDTLNSYSEPLGTRIKQFFKDNYLYGKDAAKLERSLEKLDTPGLTGSEIAAIIDQAKQPEDRFTFLIYGDLYDQLTGVGESDITYTDMGDISYFKIDGFSETTDDQFIRLVDDISSPEEKTLVLDLRGNGGGLTESANNILDLLLPELVTSTLIYRDGTSYSYYSDPDQISFRSIAVFVDENSASAAELLTLGLKTYGDRVTVIGRTTFGKGVGQLVFEDKQHKVMLYAVNHYWNVMQNNITDTRIVPDIKVTGNQLESFMNKVPEVPAP